MGTSGATFPAPAAAPAAAAGPPNLMESLGFHVWSRGKAVPGEVCRAAPDEDGIGGFVFEVVLATGIRGGLLYFA